MHNFLRLILRTASFNRKAAAVRVCTVGPAKIGLRLPEPAEKLAKTNVGLASSLSVFRIFKSPVAPNLANDRLEAYPTTFSAAPAGYGLNEYCQNTCAWVFALDRGEDPPRV